VKRPAGPQAAGEARAERWKFSRSPSPAPRDTQGGTAQAITGRGADYVRTVKGNMPTLYRQLKKLPWARIPAASSVSTGHGRRSRRTIKAAQAASDRMNDFAGSLTIYPCINFVAA